MWPASPVEISKRAILNPPVRPHQNLPFSLASSSRVVQLQTREIIGEHFQQRLNRLGECKIRESKIRGNFGLHRTHLRGAMINIGALQGFFDHFR
jgi:AraC-like DNA-binding protein